MPCSSIEEIIRFSVEVIGGRCEMNAVPFVARAICILLKVFFSAASYGRLLTTDTLGVVVEV